MAIVGNSSPVFYYADSDDDWCDETTTKRLLSSEQEGDRFPKATDAVEASTERAAREPARDARVDINDDGTRDDVKRAVESEGATVLKPLRTVEGRESGKVPTDTSGDDKDELSSLTWVAVVFAHTSMDITRIQSAKLRQREHEQSQQQVSEQKPLPQLEDQRAQVEDMTKQDLVGYCGKSVG